MDQFEFVLEGLCSPDSVEVTGCIQAQNIYSISSRDSTIRVAFENLHASRTVQLNVAENPAGWNVNGEVPVSLILMPAPSGEGYVGKNLRILESYSSLEHLPYKFVPVRELLIDIQKWIDSCPYDLLRKFAYQVLGNPSVGSIFFRIPATINRHFNEPGGLAKHSLEVAQIVYSSTLCFAEHERWLAAITGLLHEVGRVRMCVENGNYKATAGVATSEALNFEVLGPALQALEKQWVDGADVIRHILDNLCRVRKSNLQLPITSSIRSADLMSMANNQREQAFLYNPDAVSFAKIGNESTAENFWRPCVP